MGNEITLKTYSLTSFKFIRAYVLTMRPYLLFVSGITGIAGLAFAGSLNSISFALIFTSSFLSYGFGQALTDCFQIDTDSISSPYRPLTRGIVSRRHFLLVSVTGLSLCIAVFGIYNPLNLIFGILAGFGLYTYTFFKKKWWAGPFYNSWIVVCLFLMAFLAGTAGNRFPDPTLFILFTILVFTGYANFVLAGYFKDTEADKRTGYNTILVVYGRKISALISDLFAVISCTTAGIIVLPEFLFNLSAFPGLLFLLAGIFNSFNGQIKLHRIEEDNDAHEAISLVVHSYILLLSSVALILQPGWFLLLIVFYLSFNIVLKYRPCLNQV